MVKCAESGFDGVASEKNLTEYHKVINKWFDNKIVDALSGGAAADFKRFYSEILPHLDADLSRLPNAKEIKRLDRKMDKFFKDIKKEPSKFATFYKLPEVIMSKNPITKRYFRDLVLASDFHRGNMHSITSDMQQITKFLNTASGNNGFMSRFDVSASKAQTEIVKRESTYQKLLDNKDFSEAELYFKDNLKGLYADGEIGALQALHDLMADPSLVGKQLIKGTTLKYGTQLVQAANIWHNPVKSKDGKTVIAKSLKERLWKILGDGLKDNIDILEASSNSSNKGVFKLEKLNEIYNDYFRVTKNKYGQTVQPPKKVENYFPRQVLDIAPTFSKLSEDIYRKRLDTDSDSVSKYMDRMLEDLEVNLTQPNSIRPRSGESNARLSKDVLGVLDKYAKNTIRFNYNARVTKLTTQAIKDMGKLTGKLSDSHMNFILDYISDTHQAVLGLNHGNSKLSFLARTLTSYQFISKLGLNIRSAARNATQSLQNWVYFGHKAIGTAFSDMGSDRMKRILSEEMGLHGYEFVNIQEFSTPSDLMNSTKLDATGKVVESAPNTINKVNAWLEKIAKVSGKPMEWVENHVNRGMTFKIGFMMTWKRLSEDPNITRRAVKRIHNAREKTWDQYTELEQNRLIEKEIIKKSSAKAAEYVKELHYLYDPFAKIPVLRTPLGSVLGQFTTYSINFFEYQRKIAAKGGSDFLAGEWNSPAAWRLYRLGMLYTFIGGLSAATNTTWGNIIENDTYDRIKALDMWIGGTPEEKDKAYFGKHPITATFGGPVISDILKVGELINFENLSPNEWDGYVSNLKEFRDRSQDNRVEELWATINTGSKRFFLQHLPALKNGSSFPTVVGQELGLYQTNDYLNTKNKFLTNISELPGLPDAVKKALKPKKPAKQERKYTQQEVELIMSSLQQVNKKDEFGNVNDY